MKKFIVFLLSILSTFYLFSQSGNLDTSFAKNGISNSILKGIGKNGIIQNDGKIIIVGTTNSSVVHNPYDIFLARYNSDGTVDTTFGVRGMDTIDLGSTFESPEKIIMQPDDKILVGGYLSQNSHNQFFLARFKNNGEFDSTFNNTGIVVTDFNSSSANCLTDMALQPDGKIIQTGYSVIDFIPRFSIVRYNSNGSIDQNFGENGKVITSIGQKSYARNIAIQKDGKIIVAGESMFDTYDYTMVRFNENGSLDTYFGVEGVIKTNMVESPKISQDYAKSLIIQPDGKIILAGESWIDGEMQDFSLIRYMNNGSIDESFGINGKTFAMGYGMNYPVSAIMEIDGKIIIAANENHGGPIESKYFAAFVCLNQTGNVDLNYGIMSFYLGYEAWIYSIVMQPDGKIITVGSSEKDNYHYINLSRFVSPKTSNIDSDRTNHSFSIYPNPVQDNFNIKYFLESNGKISIYLYDLLGNKIMTYFESKYQISGEYDFLFYFPSEIPAGIYLFSIQGEKENILIKVFKR